MTLDIPRDRHGTFDALRVKIRDEGTVRSKAVYLALAVLPDGSRASAIRPSSRAGAALRNITATWGKEANDWRSARNQFAIVYGERFTAPGAP